MPAVIGNKCHDIFKANSFHIMKANLHILCTSYPIDREIYS